MKLHSKKIQYLSSWFLSYSNFEHLSIYLDADAATPFSLFHVQGAICYRLHGKKNNLLYMAKFYQKVDFQSKLLIFGSIEIFIVSDVSSFWNAANWSINYRVFQAPHRGTGKNAARLYVITPKVSITSEIVYVEKLHGLSNDKKSPIKIISWESKTLHNRVRATLTLLNAS